MYSIQHLFRIISTYFTNKAKGYVLLLINDETETIRSLEKWTKTGFV